MDKTVKCVLCRGKSEQVLVKMFIIFIYSTFIPTAFATGKIPEKYNAALRLARNFEYTEAIGQLKKQIVEDSVFAPAYFRLAEFYRYANKLNEGQRFFEGAIEKAPDNPNLYLGSALMAGWTQDWQTAYRQSQIAFEKGAVFRPGLELLIQSAMNSNQSRQMVVWLRRLKRRADQDHLFNLAYGLQYFENSRFANAKSYLERAVASNDQDGYACRYLGLTLLELKEPDGVYTYLNQALRLTDNRDPYQRLRALNDLGSYYQAVGNPDSTRYYFEAAFAEAQQIGGLLAQLQSCGHLANFFVDQEYFEKANDICEQGIDMAKTLNEDEKLLNFYFLLGRSNSAFGDRNDAIKNYSNAGGLAQKLGKKELIARSNFEIGKEYMNLKEWKPALEYLQRSNDLAAEFDLPELQSSALYRIAEVYSELKNLQEAKRNYETAAHYAQRLRAYNLAENCFTNLAHLYLTNSSGYSSDAEYFLHLAESLAMQTTQIHSLAIHRWMQGTIPLKEKNFEDAESLFLSSINLGRETGSNTAHLAGLAGLVKTYLDVSRFDMAAEQADSALNLFSNFRNSMVQEDAWQVFNFRQDLIFPAASAYGKFGQIVKIYKLCEEAKINDALNQLTGMQYKMMSLPEPDKWQLNKMSKKLKDKRNEFEEVWRSKYSSNKPLLLKIKNDLSSLQQQKRQLEKRLAEEYPEYFDMINPTRVPLPELAAQLTEMNASLVHYLFGDSTLIIFLIQPDSVYCKSINVPKDTLQALVRKVSPIYWEEQRAKYPGPDDKPVRLDILARLYDLLFKPIEDRLPRNSNLIISADRILNSLMFECLVRNYSELTDRQDYQSAKFLVQDYTISYIPDAKLLLRADYQKGGAGKTMAVFADSNCDYPAVGQMIHESGVYDYSDGKGSLPSPNSLTSTMEIQKITDFLPIPKRDRYLNQAIDKDRLLSQMPNYRVVHIALPLVIDDRQPLYSKLLLSNSTNGPEYLNVSDWLNSRMHADLVVLSHTVNVPGLVRKSESINTLSHTLFFAGAKSLLVNRWNIPDSASGVILSNFYYYIKTGLKKDEALRQAKLDFMQGHDRNPYEWASFVLIGDPEAIPLKFKNYDLIAKGLFVGLFVLAGLIYWRVKRRRLKNGNDHTV